ncbi:MAG: hypothetical protein WCT18_01970 [Patescibacteria group bacterium]
MRKKNFNIHGLTAEQVKEIWIKLQMSSVQIDKSNLTEEQLMVIENQLIFGKLFYQVIGDKFVERLLVGDRSVELLSGSDLDEVFADKESMRTVFKGIKHDGGPINEEAFEEFFPAYKEIMRNAFAGLEKSLKSIATKKYDAYIDYWKKINVVVDLAREKDCLPEDLVLCGDVRDEIIRRTTTSRKYLKSVKKTIRLLFTEDVLLKMIDEMVDRAFSVIWMNCDDLADFSEEERKLFDEEIKKQYDVMRIAIRPQIEADLAKQKNLSEELIIKEADRIWPLKNKRSRKV